MPQTASEGDTIVFTVLEDASNGTGQYIKWGIYAYSTVSDALNSPQLPIAVFYLANNSTFTLYYDANTSSWIYEDPEIIHKPLYMDDPSSGSVSTMNFSTETTGSPDFGLKDVFDRTSTSTTLSFTLERYMSQANKDPSKNIHSPWKISNNCKCRFNRLYTKS